MILLGEDIMAFDLEYQDWRYAISKIRWKEADLVELQNQIQFQKGFIGTTMLHPATYLNKIVVGSNSGDLQLWNTRTWYAMQRHSGRMQS
jgi:hypothetical protein